ncbi:hypothetical protein [Spongiimicrobium salis]|uniref:hypothetical protein n=1 Tax=Spongiimicrobium salis TaxID=1667022 RepID=UPI00374CE5DE
MRKFNIYTIYPGTIWLKRLGHLAMVYGIGLNLFLGNVQDRMLLEIEKGVTEIETKSKVLQVQDFPNLDILKIEKGSPFEKGYNAFRDVSQSWVNSDLPSVNRINNIANLGNVVHEESENITNYISEIKESLTVIVKVLKVASYFIWIPIIWSLIWLYCDFMEGSHRRFLKFFIMLAIPLNIIAYVLLSNYVLDAIQLDL